MSKIGCTFGTAENTETLQSVPSQQSPTILKLFSSGASRLEEDHISWHGAA